MDGLLYREHFSDDGFFHNTSSQHKKTELHLSFQMNFDGVALFRSSKFSIWPVYYSVNELPPKDRYQRRNRIFAGLWFGFRKPETKTFLKPFAESFKEMFEKGMPLQVPEKNTNITVRVILLSAVFDAPARCMFMECVQFNGMYGCPYCLAPGETVKTSVRGHTRAYPYDRENPATGHKEERTHKSTFKFAKEAARSIQSGKAK
ncbi:uncharacterized protein [Ptychodera flava]|uniref:uncharacterized protein n=1 Tax=Ptychodera flava TaxID=63121 RepID=UPI00396A08C0